MESQHSVSVLWRGKKYVVEMNSGGTLRDLGDELHKLTEVKADTMRFIVPHASNGSSNLLYPFSEEHSSRSLCEAGIVEGKFIRMMGVSETEVEEILQNEKKDFRIAGFDEEEKRQRQRMSRRPHSSFRLPQGPYVFCDFRTLQLPGVELNPPPSEALKRMHMLAADPGIVAIMNKHRWRVGIMTEMAPVGYVGVSPKCILGYNKNHGEEISLRLRTDDLKGFRKYESIKKTLLHELAHMVYSEHDADFYALDSQLNREAASLDWTRSRSHTLSGFGHLDLSDELVDDIANVDVLHKLGGNLLEPLASARESSVAAAYRRLANTSASSSGVSEVSEEPDPDDTGYSMHGEPHLVDTPQKNADYETIKEVEHGQGPVNAGFVDKSVFETDPDDSGNGQTFPSEQPTKIDGNNLVYSPASVVSDLSLFVPPPRNIQNLAASRTIEEPDPDDNLTQQQEVKEMDMNEPDPDDNLTHQQEIKEMDMSEPDPDDQELQRIQDPVTDFCRRLEIAIQMLRSEVSPMEVSTVLQTIFKIIRNVIEHPNDIKFKRLRKANPAFQRTVAKYKAAMEILHLVGFSEDVTWDETGKAATYLILKRNDLGLLWLAKSSLEACGAC